MVSARSVQPLQSHTDYTTILKTTPYTNSNPADEAIRLSVRQLFSDMLPDRLRVLILSEHSRNTKPHLCGLRIFGNAQTFGVHHPEMQLRFGVPLPYSFAVPFEGSSVILFHAISVGVELAETILSFVKAFPRCLFYQVESGTSVLRDTGTGPVEHSERVSARAVAISGKPFPNFQRRSVIFVSCGL